MSDCDTCNRYEENCDRCGKCTCNKVMDTCECNTPPAEPFFNRPATIPMDLYLPPKDILNQPRWD